MLYQNWQHSLHYDYDKQVWIQGGRYLSCAHPTTMACQCYGRLHAGEVVRYMAMAAGHFSKEHDHDEI